jgi:dCMP deaminase
MKNILRPSWDAYFMSIAHIVQSRSNCIRGARGAILTKDKRIIATGYNGTPSGVTDCDKGGCKRCLDRAEGRIKSGEYKDLCICVHAEENALIQAAYHGVSTKGTTMYATVSPCTTCAKSIINAGVVEVIFDDEHSDDFGEKLLLEAGVKVRKYK